MSSSVVTNVVLGSTDVIDLHPSAGPYVDAGLGARELAANCGEPTLHYERCSQAVYHRL